MVAAVDGRGRDGVPSGAQAVEDACEAAALSAPKIAEELAGRTPRKVIFVPGKLVNIVA